MGEAKRKRDRGLAKGYTEAEVKTICAIQFVLMMLFMERNDEWWGYCANESFKYPHGSYRQVFWWSLRGLGGLGNENLQGEELLTEFRGYFTWKWSEFESGRLRREGPKW
jgi:hypothetical protein